MSSCTAAVPNVLHFHMTYKPALQAKENKLDALLADLRCSSSQAAPLSSFQVLCSMDKLRGKSHAARESARARHLQVAVQYITLHEQRIVLH